jgi:hypothetical protein
MLGAALLSTERTDMEMEPLDEYNFYFQIVQLMLQKLFEFLDLQTKLNAFIQHRTVSALH